MLSYCARERRQTDCIPGSEKYVKSKNGRLIMKCVCASCGITKTRFVKKTGKLISPPGKRAKIQGEGIFADLIGTAKKKSKITGSILPSTKHVFDRYWSGDILKSAFGTDHGIFSKQFWTGPPKDKRFAWRYNPKIGKQEEVEIQLRSNKNNMYEWYYSDTGERVFKGSGIDIHKTIGKLPRPKAGYTPGKYKYVGPYNPLHEQ